MNYKLFMYPGYLVGISCLGLITYRTILAIATQSKTVIVQMNQYGEEYLDVLFLVFLWTVCLIGLLSLRTVSTTKTTQAPKRYSHHKTIKEHQKVPLDFTPYHLSYQSLQGPSGIGYTSTELSKMLSELDEEPQPVAPANEKTM